MAAAATYVKATPERSQLLTTPERQKVEEAVELTYIDDANAALSPQRRRIIKFLIGGAAVALIGCIGLITILLIQLKMDHYPSHQHVLVVDIKNDVVEAALIRRSNPAIRRVVVNSSNYNKSSLLLDSTVDSHVIDVCGRRGDTLQRMAEECVNVLVKSLPKRSVASLLFVMTGHEVLRQWVGCNVTADAKRIGDIAVAIAKQHPTRLKLADESEQGVHLVSAKEQAVSAFIGANRLHLETASTGVIGVDSKSAYLGFHYVPPKPQPPKNANITAELSVFDEQIAGSRITAFSEAFYCFGVDELWRIYLATLLGNNRKSSSAKDPCAPAHSMYTLDWDDVWQTACSEVLLKSQTQPRQCKEDEQSYRQVARIVFTGSGNPVECRNRLAAIFKLAQGSNHFYAGRRIPQDLRGEFIFFDGSGSVARALEFVFKDREGPEKKDETVLDGRYLFLHEMTTAVYDFCAKSLDPKQIRESFGINTTRQENEGYGPNSDHVLRRTCFNAFYGLEFLGSLGISRAKHPYNNPKNHIVLAKPPASSIDPVAAKTSRAEYSQHDDTHDPSSGIGRHAGHWTADWLTGYLETGTAVGGDFRRVRPLSLTAFVILLVILAVCDVSGLAVVTVFALRLWRLNTRPQLQIR